MKKMKKVIYVCLIALISFSCSVNEDNVLFDPVNGQTLVNFATATADLPILLNGTGSVDIQVEVTTISTEDRVFNVNIDEDQTTADPANYTLGQAIVPANSFLGTLTIQGVDVTVEVAAETLVLEFVEENGIVTDTPIIVSVFQVCPVRSDFFTGTYLMEQLSGVGPFATLQTVFDVQTVEITVDPNDELVRVFDYQYSPSTFASDFQLQISLVCDTFQVNGDIQTGSLSCDGATQIGQTTGTVPSFYSVPDGDDMFEITITDFAEGRDGGCGVDPYDALVRFTKQ